MSDLPESNYDPDPDSCYIVGGGPSLTNFDWSQLTNKFVIAINRAYEVLPDADVVYFTDDTWYREHKAGLLKHSGLLIKGSTAIRGTIDKSVQQYKLVHERGLQTKEGTLSHGSNSTYAAINLAGIHLGFKKIYLLGIDLQYNGKRTHWHDGHTRIDPESVYNKMLKNFMAMGPLLKQHEIEVFNINNPEKTRLQCFPFSDRLVLSSAPYIAPAVEHTPHQAPKSPIKIRSQQDLIKERRKRVQQIQRANATRKSPTIYHSNRKR